MASSMPVVSQLEQFLSLTNKRETVIASNMANVDTPNYRTQDINFQGELNRALNAQNGNAGALPQVNVHNVQGLMERPDGNNVDLDRESMLLSEVQLQYQLGTQLLKSRFHQLLSAISSGGQ